jgi:hypothetical protein
VSIWRGFSSSECLVQCLYHCQFPRIVTLPKFQWSEDCYGCLFGQANYQHYLEKELANRTSASVWSINLDFQGQVNSITLTINHSIKSLKLKRCTTQYKYNSTRSLTSWRSPKQRLMPRFDTSAREPQYALRSLSTSTRLVLFT